MPFAFRLDVAAVLAAPEDDTFCIAQAFLGQLAPGETVFDFRCLDDSKHRRAPALTRMLHGTLEDRWADMKRLNERGAGIFVTVNKTDGKGIKSGNVMKVRAVWHDDDAKGGIPAFPLAPSMTVKTSEGKYHRYWFVDDMTPDQFKGVMRCMVDVYGSDKGVSDIGRILRLPGTYNMKGEPQLVEIAKDTGARYTGEALAAAFPAPAEPRKDRQPTVSRLPDVSGPRGDQRRADIESALAAIPSEGQPYDIWLDIGMALHAEYGQAGRFLWDSWSRNPKFDTANQEKKWRSFKDIPGGITGNKIFYIARLQGWKCERREGDEKELLAMQGRILGKGSGPRGKKDPKRSKIEIIPYEQIDLDRNPAYIIKDVIPKIGLVVVWGAAKAGKSFWVYDLCMHIALGRDYRGKRTKKGTVVYGCFEGASVSRQERRHIMPHA